jgi:head-tail adaptor
MSFEALLNDTCTIESKTAAQTDSGELSLAWTSKATDVKTRRATNKNPSVVNTIGQVTVAHYTFYFLPDTDITEADRIVFDSATYDVVLVSKDSSGHHLQVLANKTSME